MKDLAYVAPKNLIKRELNMYTPETIYIMSTELCNSRCTHCNIWMNKKTHDPLSPEEIVKMLKDPIFKNIHTIFNSGGEPTLRQDLLQVLLAEHEALPNATLSMTTNALMPERALAAVKGALEAGIPISVGTSIDGVDSVHDTIKGVIGNFKKADWLLHKLKELKESSAIYSKLSIHAGTVLVDSNMEDIPRIEEYLKGMGMPLSILFFNAASYYNKEGTVMEHNREAVKKILEKRTQTLLSQKWVDWCNGKPINFTCFALYNFLLVKSNGDVVPCFNFWDKVAGNVRQNTPSEIWHSEKMNEIRNTVVKPCAGCLNSFAVTYSVDASKYPK